MHSALLFSTALGFVALLALPHKAPAPDLSPVFPARAARIAPPGLIRGVMTNDLKTLAYVGANSCLLWGAPPKPDAWDQHGRAKQFVLLNSLGPVKQEFFEYEGKKPVRMTTPYCWSNEFGAWWIEHVAQGAAKKYPAVVCVTPDEVEWNNGIVPYLFNVTQPVGVKFYCDCRRGDETRFTSALTTKHLLAARPRIGALPCLAATVYDYREKFDWTEAYHWRKEIEDLLPTPVLDAIRKDLAPYKLADEEIILPALSAVAHGAKGVRFFGDEQRDALKRLFTLMEKLEKPLAGATVPGEVVVPFCTHLSNRSAAALSEPPLERKTIVFAHRGQMDEDGNPRPKPAFEGIPARFVSFDGEASDVLRDAAGRKKLADAIGGVFDVRAQCGSEDVERAWLKLADGGVALFLINWGDEARTVQVQLPGAAEATRFDTSGTSTEVGVKFDVEVAPRDAQIVIQSGVRR